MVRVWREKERLEGQIVDALTAVITTRGCRWDKCLMCGYTADSAAVDMREVDRQLEEVAERVRKEGVKVVKVFTSGSFFDEVEVRRDIRERFYSLLKGRVEKLVVESRPEFLNGDVVDEIEDLPFSVEVGIGLESANDAVRNACVNKGFSFRDFRRAAEMLREADVRVKCYLLLKPPFLSEGESIEDVVKSVEAVRDLVDVISINPTNVQKGTVVERLWKSKLYRPPWLWSVVEVLRTSLMIVEGVDVISDPVAAGKRRGAHNCGKCDDAVAREIRKASLTQKPNFKARCGCIEKWRCAVELESYARVPMFD